MHRKYEIWNRAQFLEKNFKGFFYCRQTTFTYGQVNILQSTNMTSNDQQRYNKFLQWEASQKQKPEPEPEEEEEGVDMVSITQEEYEELTACKEILQRVLAAIPSHLRKQLTGDQEAPLERVSSVSKITTKLGIVKEATEIANSRILKGSSSASMFSTVTRKSILPLSLTDIPVFATAYEQLLGKKMYTGNRVKDLSLNYGTNKIVTTTGPYYKGKNCETITFYLDIRPGQFNISYHPEDVDERLQNSIDILTQYEEMCKEPQQTRVTSIKKPLSTSNDIAKDYQAMALGVKSKAKPLVFKSPKPKAMESLLDIQETNGSDVKVIKPIKTTSPSGEKAANIVKALEDSVLLSLDEPAVNPEEYEAKQDKVADL